MEFAVTQPGGTRRWFEAVAEPLTAGDRTWGGVIAIRDLSERTMRLSLERLMAAAGHELKTPVAALHGYLQLVERHLGPEDSAQARDLCGPGARADEADRRARRAPLRREPHPGRSTRTDRRTTIDLVAVVRDAVDVAETLPNAPTIRVSPTRGSILAPGRCRPPGAGLRQSPRQRRRARGDIADHRRDRASIRLDAIVEVRDHGPGIAASAAAAVPAVYAAGAEAVGRARVSGSTWRARS
jgi:signal transduction histidine kinase